MEKITFISLEHPVIEYYDKKYITYINITTRRYGRSDPKYYMSMHAISLITIDNNLMVDIHFHTFTGSTYKRTFLELHYKVCDMLTRDTFFGSLMKRGTFRKPCPLPAGEHHVENCTLPIENVPLTLSFKKGRIFTNVKYSTGASVIHGYIDFEFKEKQVRGKQED